MIINMAGGKPTVGAVKKGTIAVEYPAGSSCMVKSPQKEYAALDTAGSAGFVVDAGSWTVSAAIPGGKEVSKELTVENGKAYSVRIIFEEVLYEVGNEYEDITGGWTATGGTLQKDGGLVCKTSNFGSQKVLTAKKIDVTELSELEVTFEKVGITASQGAYAKVCIFDDTKNIVAEEDAENSNSAQTVSLNITEYTGEYFVGIALGAGNPYSPPIDGATTQYYPASATATKVRLV